MRKRLRLFIALVLAALGPVAGVKPVVAQPETYEDCVLRKMKGQDRSLLPVAKNACQHLQAHPREKVEEAIDDRLVRFEWSALPSGGLSLTLKEVQGGFEVRRVRAIMYRDPCGTPPSDYGHMAEGVSAGRLSSLFGGSRFNFVGEPSTVYKCAIFTFFGVRR